MLLNYSSIRLLYICKQRDSNEFQNHFRIFSARMVRSAESVLLWVLPRFKNVYIMHKHTSLQQKGVHKKIDFLGDESPLDSTPPPSLINQHYFLEKNKKYTYFANSIHTYICIMYVIVFETEYTEMEGLIITQNCCYHITTQKLQPSENRSLIIKLILQKGLTKFCNIQNNFRTC